MGGFYANFTLGGEHVLNLTVLINLEENNGIPGFIFDIVLVNIVFILALFHLTLKRMRPHQAYFAV